MTYLIIEHNLLYLFCKVNYFLFNFQGVLPQTCMKNQWLIEKHQNYKPKKTFQSYTDFFLLLRVSDSKYNESKKMCLEVALKHC